MKPAALPHLNLTSEVMASRSVANYISARGTCGAGAMERVMDRRSVVKSAAMAGVGAAAMAVGSEAVEVTTANAAPVSAVVPNRSFVETRDGVTLFYHDWGSGKPI